MSEKIPTFAQCFGGRDACCIAAVGNMAAMGRFETVFTVYGCAYQEGEEITYRITPSAEQLHEFITKSSIQDIYPTNMLTFNWSTPVPTGMKEVMAHKAKLKLARILQQTYSHQYFDLLELFCHTPEQNSTADLLYHMVQNIDGHFNEKELQLLEGTIQICYNAKLLQKENLHDLQQWIYKTRRQMEDDPVIQTDLSRQFYGFCYQQKNKPIQAVVNAQPLLVWEQHTKAHCAGYLTGPIIEETFWLNNAADIPDKRTTFRQKLLQLQGNHYFELLQTIKTLPSAIDTALFLQAFEQLQSTNENTLQSIKNFQEYGYRWNCLPMN